LVTDGSVTYKFQTDKHESVDHSKYEWARGDVHTNTLEGFFSVFKRGEPPRLSRRLQHERGWSIWEQQSGIQWKYGSGLCGWC